eukprot:gene16743-19092_t
MNDYGMRSLSEDSGNNLNHIHVESLCETMSDFLDSLEGSAAEFNNAELVEKKLSESECSILDCQLVVADIKSVSEDIDKTFIPSLERDIQQLHNIFVHFERITNQVIPALDQDLIAIEQLIAECQTHKIEDLLSHFDGADSLQDGENASLSTAKIPSSDSGDFAAL